jgi:hypothetical protein
MPLLVQKGGEFQGLGIKKGRFLRTGRGINFLGSFITKKPAGALI